MVGSGAYAPWSTVAATDLHAVPKVVPPPPPTALPVAATVMAATKTATALQLRGW